MSRDFIGSKISIITKSQCRYSGTIIGIDAQTSSIVLGNCRSFGVENRPATSSNNGHPSGTVLPIVQFANSDIEDLKIVDEEQTSEPVSQQPSYSMTTSAPSRVSIHDDPAIVSAVVSSTNKDTNNTLNGDVSSNRLIQNLQHMSLNDERSKTGESHLRSNADELGTPWSLLSSSKLNHTNASIPQNLGQKSKFFDDFFADKSTTNNRTNNQRSSNTHSTQTSRENAGHQYDTNGLPVRQPFFSNDRSYPQRQYQHQQQHQQQQYRNQNGYNQRQFYNQRRPFNSNQQRRPGAGGNRETFQDNPNDYDADFDFESSNMKFNKLTGDDDIKSPLEQLNPVQTNVDASPLYDKKKSFFDNLALGDSSDGPALHSNNRSKNYDTFGYNGYQRQNNRSNGHGYRRSNNNNHRQQYGDEDFHYRQHNNNNNGYRYRY